MTFCMYYAPYSFTNRFKKDGSKTRWYSVYTFLKEHGPATKAEIVEAVWGRTREDFDLEWSWGNYTYVTNSLRGFCSNTFAQMNFQGVCVYNRSTKKWEAGVLPTAA